MDWLIWLIGLQIPLPWSAEEGQRFLMMAAPVYIAIHLTIWRWQDEKKRGKIVCPHCGKWPD